MTKREGTWLGFKHALASNTFSYHYALYDQ